MINCDYSVRIFDPVFTYERAAKEIGEYYELHSFLCLTRSLMERTRFRSEPPLATAFYNYFPNIAVLIRKDETYYCQTYLNGCRNRVYDVLKETDELKEFFNNCKKELTVLDNERCFEFPPDFEVVRSYAECFEKARLKSEKHKATIAPYATNLQKIEYEFDDSRGMPLNDTYKEALGIAKRYINVLNAIADETCDAELCEARKYPLAEENAHCRIFGLYVYALQFGIDRERFLSKRGRAVFIAFNEMIKEMRSFMANYPEIEEDYCTFFNLQANERAKLRDLLEREGFYNKSWGFIGDDIFC